MAIDPNIIFNSRLPLTYDQMQQNKLHLQGMDIANQTNQIVLDQAKEAQAFQRALNEALKTHSSAASDTQTQPLTAGTTPAATDNDGTGSASLGRDAYGNLIPKVGVESPSGNSVPDNMTGPPSVLSAAAQIPTDIPHPYETPSSATTSSAVTETGQPAVSSSTLQTAVNPPQQGVATMAPAGNSPSATGYATIMGPNGRTMTLPTTYAGIQTNWDKVMSDLTDKGYGVQAMSANMNRAKAMMAGLQMQEAQFKAEGEKMKTFGSIAGSVSPVTDWTDQNQIAMAKASAQNALQLGLQKGVIEPHHAVALLQAINQQGYTPQIQAEIQQAAKMGMDSYQQYMSSAQHMRDLNTFMDSAVKRQGEGATLIKTRQEIAEKQAETAASALATAYRNGGAAGYQAMREAMESQNPSLQGRFPENPKTEQDILDAGMNAKDVAANRLRQGQQKATEDYRKSTLENQKARLGIAAKNADTQAARAAAENPGMSPDSGMDIRYVGNQKYQRKSGTNDPWKLVK